MTCPDVRPLLPAYVYGDLPSEEADAVARHLRDCRACRAESAALAHVRSALDATPAAAAKVDVPALFVAAADRRAVRWRRLALAGAALAAGLLLVVGLRMHVTVGNGQVVIAWGSGVSRDAEVLRSGARQGVALRSEDSASRLTDFDDRVRLLQELTHALAADVETRDRQRQYETDALRIRLDAVQQLAAQRWAESERMMSALYVAQFKRPEEKLNP